MNLRDFRGQSQDYLHTCIGNRVSTVTSVLELFEQKWSNGNFWDFLSSNICVLTLGSNRYETHFNQSINPGLSSVSQSKDSVRDAPAARTSKTM